MSARAGLVGLYQPPTLSTNANSVYMITDENNASLFIFILYPGAYDTAYKVASNPWYKNVFIVPVSLDALYVSDVARLVNDLYTKKHIVKVFFPGKFCAYVPVGVQKALIDSDRKTYYQYKNGIISFNYKFSEADYQPNFYDIFATFRTRRCLFCPFEVKKERILTLFKNGDVDWVYVPYSDPMFGTDSYATLVIDEDFAPYMNHIIACGFFNETQVNYCKGRYPNSFPRTLLYEFMRNDNAMDTGNPPIVGGEPIKGVGLTNNLPNPDGKPTPSAPIAINPKPVPLTTNKPIQVIVEDESVMAEIPEEASEDE